MRITIGSLVKRFYESNSYSTYPTDLLANCSQFPVVVQVSGRLHGIKKITFNRGAMVFVAADAEYKEKKS